MKQEQALENLFHRNPQPMWFYRVADLAFLDVNDAAVALYGYSREEFLGMTLRDIRPPDAVAAVVEEIRGLDAGSFISDRTYVHRKKDGALLHVRLTAHGVSYAGHDARLVSVQDMTEERRAMQALRQEQEHSRRTLETMLDGVAVCDREGRITYFNPSLRAMIGLPDSTQEGRYGDAYTVYHPDGVTPLQPEDAPMFRALRGETVRGERFVAVPFATGRPVHILIGATPLHADDGSIEGAVVVVHDITAIIETQQALQERERNLSTMMANLPGMVYRVRLDPGSPMEFVSSGCRELTGVTAEELLAGGGERYAALVHPADFDWLMGKWSSVDERFADRDTYQFTYRIVTAGGATKWVWEQGTGLRDESGRIARIEGIVLDISERVRAQQDRERSEERFLRATLGANDGIWDWNLRSGQVYYSDRWHEQLGYEPGTLETLPEEWINRVHADDREALERAIQAHMEGVADHIEIEHRLRHRDGSYRWMLARGLKSHSAAEDADHLSGSLTDITTRKHAEEQLQHDAFHDVLTGLPNRALLLDRLSQAIKVRRRDKDKHFALLYLDLDRFKYVNDSLGHAAGDEVLKEIARRWQKVIREYDTLARLGGDEFALLLENIHRIEDAQGKAAQLLLRLEEPVWVAGQEFTLGASAGIAYSDMEFERAEDCLRDADAAMYQAKAGGRNQVILFEPSMRTLALKSFRLETELRNAVASNELLLYYQPIVHMDSREVSGYEALVRWKHRVRGMIPPMEFIPFAEESGLIVQIDLWVLDAACRQMAEWLRAGKVPAGTTISVNLSARQMGRAGLPQEIEAMVARHALPPGTLIVELTETALITNIDTAKEIMLRLRELGVGVVLDDFGTGYSSLSYLYQFPFDGIKVDQSFVRQLDKTENVDHLMELIQALGERMKVNVVPEGIETETELARLREMGFKRAQGYFFGRPLPAEDVVG